MAKTMFCFSSNELASSSKKMECSTNFKRNSKGCIMIVKTNFAIYVRLYTCVQQDFFLSKY